MNTNIKMNPNKIVIGIQTGLKEQLVEYAKNLNITPTAAARVILSKELNKPKEFLEVR